MFRIVDCPEQMETFGEVIVGRGVTVTFDVVTALEQPFKV